MSVVKREETMLGTLRRSRCGRRLITFWIVLAFLAVAVFPQLAEASNPQANTANTTRNFTINSVEIDTTTVYSSDLESKRLEPLTTMILIGAAIGGASSGIMYSVDHFHNWNGGEFASYVAAGAIIGAGSVLVAVFGAAVIGDWLGHAVTHGGAGHAAGDALTPALAQFIRNSVSTIGSWSQATFSNVKAAILSDPDSVEQILAADIADLEEIAGGPQPVTGSDELWADFKDAVPISHGMSITTVGMEHTGNSSWRMFAPGQSSLTIDFVLVTTTDEVWLNLTHLTSASDQVPSGGYSPVDITVNGTKIEENYDVAEEHSGQHGYQYDSWDISNFAVSGQNSILIDFENDPWAETDYWIQTVSITPFVLDFTNPEVIRYNHSTSTDAIVDVFFSEPLDSSSITNSSVLVNGSVTGSHSSQFQFNPIISRLNIQPVGDFTFGELVTVTLTTNLRDVSGNPLREDYVLSFRIDGSAIHDTYVSETNPSTSYCNEPDLIVDGDSRGMGEYSSLIQVAIPELPDDHHIKRAALRLYCKSLNTTQGNDIRVHKVHWSDDWDECVVDWSSKPRTDLYSDKVKMDSPGKWYEFDITAIVDYWYNNSSWHNNGVFLDSYEKVFASFSSWNDESNHPTAEFEFEADVPDFAVSLTPPEIIAEPGDNADFTVNVTGLLGFHWPVQLTVSCTAPCETATLAQTEITPDPTASTVLTVATTQGCAQGRYDICVEASYGASVRVAKAVLQLGGLNGPSFTISDISGEENQPTESIVIHYETTDPYGRNMTTIGWQFSTDAGVSWNDIADSSISDNDPKPPGGNTVIWSTQNEIPTGKHNVLFRMKVDNGLNIGDKLAGFYQYDFCDGEPNNPVAICFAGPYMYVFDRSDEQIYKFTVTETGFDCSPHAGDYPKSLISGNYRAITYDPLGQRFYALDYIDDDLDIYDADWNYISDCAGLPNFGWPGIAFDWKRNEVLVTLDDSDNREIRRGYPCPGATCGTVEFTPGGIAFDGGSYWLMKEDGPDIYKSGPGVCGNWTEHKMHNIPIDAIAYYDGALYSVSISMDGVTAHNIRPRQSEYFTTEYFEVCNVCVSPVTVGQFTAVESADHVQLTWSVITDEAIEGLVVFRSEEDINSMVDVSGHLPPSANSYVDRDVKPGRKYTYKLSFHGRDGVIGESWTAQVTVKATSLLLSQNYPNPFNPSTVIAFTTPKNVDITLAIYDSKGAWVKTVARGNHDPGYHEYMWDGTNANGATVSSGLYFYRLRAGNRVMTKKMLLLK